MVATAFEDATLFSMSVRENLSLGRPGATDDDVDEALRVAQAEFVHDLPWGLDTRIGEQGLSLSGGQRQRLALARAVLGRPSVLVLDDPLSALDVHTEALVERALREVLADTTALVVAHRASTVLLADRVALLETAGSPPWAGTPTCWPRCRPTASCSAPRSRELAAALRAGADRGGVSMSTPDTDLHADWRGVASEDSEELSASAGSFLRGRSRRLLAELLRAAPAGAVAAAGDHHGAEPAPGWPARS